MTLLYIVWYTMYRPYNCGGGIRDLRFLQALRKMGHTVVVACPANVTEVQPIDGIDDAFLIPKKFPRHGLAFRRRTNRFFWKLTKWIDHDPSNLQYPLMPTMLDLGKWFPGVKFDGIVIRRFEFLKTYRPKLGIPVFCDLDDDPLESFDTIVAPKLGSIQKIAARLYLKWQLLHCLPSCRCVWLSNHDSITRFRAFKTKTVELPNEVPPPPATYSADCANRKSLLFVGSLYYVPNREGLVFFLDRIWPTLHLKHPEIVVNVVGRGLDQEEQKRLSKIPGVVLHGYVKDLELLYEKSFATLAPIFSGSGTAIKVLESLSHSRPCIGSEFAFRGFSTDEIRRTNGLYLCTDLNDWIDAVGFIVKQEPGARTWSELDCKNFISRKCAPEKFDHALMEGLAS